jgi:hypothetical protein
MKIVSSYLVLLFSVASLGAADTATTNGIGPRIQFATNNYNYGRQITGTKVNYTFIFTNIGDQVLEVPGAQGSCHCTTAGDWTRRVEPGKTGSIPVTFDSTGFSGQISRTVTVQCNDKTQPTVVLTVTGSIWKPIEVNPQMAYFSPSEDSQSVPPCTVHIISNLEEPLTLFSVESNNKTFTAVLKTNEPGKHYELIISAVPPFSPGTVQGQIVMKTSWTNTPVLNVSTMASVQPAVTLAPGQINLPAAPLETAVNSTLTIINNGPDSLKLSDAAISAHGVDVQINELQPGRTFTVSLVFPKGFEPPFGLPLEFSVKSSHSKYSLLKAPVNFAPRVVGGPGKP